MKNVIRSRKTVKYICNINIDEKNHGILAKCKTCGCISTWSIICNQCNTHKV